MALMNRHILAARVLMPSAFIRLRLAEASPYAARTRLLRHLHAAHIGIAFGSCLLHGGILKMFVVLAFQRQVCHLLY